MDRGLGIRGCAETKLTKTRVSSQKSLPWWISTLEFAKVSQLLVVPQGFGLCEKMSLPGKSWDHLVEEEEGREQSLQDRRAFDYETEIV